MKDFARADIPDPPLVWEDIAAMSDGKIPRDRYGRPVLPPASGGKAKPYTRVTTLAETLDDRFNLEKWKNRQVAIGLMLNPDLLSLVAAQQNDKAKLDETCDKAIEMAKGTSAANTGTALHQLTERLHAGEDLGHIPAHLQADLAAYVECLTRHLIEVVEVEQFVVWEAMEVAGTLDRLMRFPDGRLAIGDLKTGAGAVDYGLTSIAVQLACYAHAETSWSLEGGHIPRPQVDRTRAYVLHLPPGSGRCELVEVNIVDGLEAAHHAKWARHWRKRRDLGRSVTDAADELEAKRDLLARRIHALPQGGVDALARMAGDAELPRVSASMYGQLDDWADLLTVVEAEFEVPFLKVVK